MFHSNLNAHQPAITFEILMGHVCGRMSWVAGEIHHSIAVRPISTLLRIQAIRLYTRHRRVGGSVIEIVRSNFWHGFVL
jgi:hypothetical protein